MAVTQANDILNGYFYTFVYKARSNGMDVDESPLIYCIGPSSERDNNFVGLNFHKLPEIYRETLIKGMHKAAGILESNSRAVFTPQELNSIAPGCIDAIREYSRKRVYYPLRIDTTEIIPYLYGDGKTRVQDNKGLYDFIMDHWKGFLGKK